MPKWEISGNRTSLLVSILSESLLGCSDTVTGTTQGRVLCRLVSMFDSIDALVDENDRRRTLAMDMEEVEETQESVLPGTLISRPC